MLCVTHRKKRRGCYKTQKQAMLLFARVWSTVLGPLPLRGLWGGRKSAGFGGRESRLWKPWSGAVSPLSTLQAPGTWQLSLCQPLHHRGSQKGCAFVVLPSLFRFRGGQKQEGGFSADEAALLPFTCGN